MSQEHGLPTQSWHGSHVQWNAGKNDGFVLTARRRSSRNSDRRCPRRGWGWQYWTATELPFYHGLASTFPLMDRWFSSCMGPTFPNRRFLIAGTAHGLIDNVPTGLFDYPEAGTIFDLLTAHGIDWVNYHHQTPLSSIRIGAARLLGKPGLVAIRALGLVAALLPGLRGIPRGQGWVPRVHHAAAPVHRRTCIPWVGGVRGTISVRSRRSARTPRTEPCHRSPSSIPTSASSPKRTRKTSPPAKRSPHR